MEGGSLQFKKNRFKTLLIFSFFASSLSCLKSEAITSNSLGDAWLNHVQLYDRMQTNQDTFLPSMTGADGSACVIAGYIGKIVHHSCNYSFDAKALIARFNMPADAHPCNPDLFGEGAYIEPSDLHGNNKWTEACAQKVLNDLTGKPKFANIVDDHGPKMNPNQKAELLTTLQKDKIADLPKLIQNTSTLCSIAQAEQSPSSARDYADCNKLLSVYQTLLGGANALKSTPSKKGRVFVGGDGKACAEGDLINKSLKDLSEQSIQKLLMFGNKGQVVCTNAQIGLSGDDEPTFEDLRTHLDAMQSFAKNNPGKSCYQENYLNNAGTYIVGELAKAKAHFDPNNPITLSFRLGKCLVKVGYDGIDCKKSVCSSKHNCSSPQCMRLSIQPKKEFGAAPYDVLNFPMGAVPTFEDAIIDQIKYDPTEDSRSIYNDVVNPVNDLRRIERLQRVRGPEAVFNGMFYDPQLQSANNFKQIDSHFDAKKEWDNEANLVNEILSDAYTPECIGTPSTRSREL